MTSTKLHAPLCTWHTPASLPARQMSLFHSQLSSHAMLHKNILFLLNQQFTMHNAELSFKHDYNGVRTARHGTVRAYVRRNPFRGMFPRILAANRTA